MAELRFFFGTMGSGKSTQALQIRHNLAARGLNVILTTQLDRQAGKVSSRLGVEAEAEIGSIVAKRPLERRSQSKRYSMLVRP